MFGLISNYKHLYVADFSKIGNYNYKIVYSNASNLKVDGTIMMPFAKDIENDISILISNSNNIKKLSCYVNCFGFPMS